MKTTCHAAGITAAPLSPQEWRALLRAKGWKQKELARRWNVSETWISKLANNPERGHALERCLPGSARYSRPAARRTARGRHRRTRAGRP